MQPGLAGAEVGVAELHAGDTGGPGLAPAMAAAAVVGAVSARLKSSTSMHQPIPSPPLCTFGSTRALQSGVQCSMSFGLKNQNQVLLTPKTFLFIFRCFFQMEMESFPGLGRIKVHSTLHQIVSLDPRVNAFLSSDLEGFIFLSIWQEKGKSQFSVQVTAKQGLELELAFQAEHCAKTHQLFPPLPSTHTGPWSGSLFLE